MSDDLMLDPETQTRKTFPPHPAGPTAAIICDVINLGSKVKRWPGEPDKLVPMIAIIFRTHEHREDGVPWDLSLEFTKSLGDKANLQKFLVALWGRALGPKEKVDLAKLANTPCLISVVHNPSADGKRTYSNIGTVMPLPKGMMAPVLAHYTRSEYWAERKAKFAQEVAAFEASQHQQPPVDDEEGEWEPA